MADFVSNALVKSTRIIRLLLPKRRRKPCMSWSLYGSHGRRKYLVPKERRAFLLAAQAEGGDVGTFCSVLGICGARISEVLALTPELIDDGNRAINFETLKRRRRGVIRAVPVPEKLLDELQAVHGFRQAQYDPTKANGRLWSWSRTTAWRRVKEVMRLAELPEYVSKPKALRHAFGAEAVLNQVPLTLIKKWMGHAKLETTEVYTSLTGEEERMLARLTWRRMPNYF
jgi:integrase